MKYPDGKLNENDNGELGIIVYVKDGRVILYFGKDISWIGFDKHTLKTLIDGLQKKYEEI